MTFADLESVFALFCTIVGLLCCLFKYIEVPRRGCLYLIIFFLTHFLSDYYWTIYSLATRSDPDVAGFITNLGWNIGYIFLLLAVLELRYDGARGFFHPVMLLPVIINIPQLILYCSYGSILNNLWEVGITTLIMVCCLKGIMYYHVKKKEYEARFPHFYVLVLIFMLMEYGMWTASCFAWPSEVMSPYLYCTMAGSAIMIFFPWGIGRDYADDNDITDEDDTELRVRTLIQAVMSILIFGGCAGGYYLAVRIMNTMPYADVGNETVKRNIAMLLFTISTVMIVLIVGLMLFTTSRYRLARKLRKESGGEGQSRFNFFFTIAVTLALMVFALIYNTRVIYSASITSIYDDGENRVKMIATDLANYLTVAEATLRVTADTVDMMEQEGTAVQDIARYLTDQTVRQSEKFDENFTGIYGYIDGEYVDGSGWDPPEGYDPVSRDWYQAAVDADGKVVIVSPYVDAQTGSVVITIAKSFAGAGAVSGASMDNVICLDVIVGYIREVTEQINLAGKGYGFVLNADGFIVAHHDESLDGQSFQDIYGEELLDRIITGGSEIFNATMDEAEHTFFVSPIMDQWYAVIVVNNTELFESMYSQLTVNILVTLITFLLISFFYYLGYRNEQSYGRKVEEMNLHVVTALAAAIDAKDNYTNGHSSRVARYSRVIAARAGYSESGQNEIYMMGLLHDVGKIGVPDSVINKPSRLTDEEFELIKKHPVIGSSILSSIKEKPQLSTGARWHHERYGGGGYPDGISGEDIPEEARIIAVADAYDAMTSRRSYRDVMPQDKVRAEIEKGIGTQFDPHFARIMLRLIDEDTDYTMRES